MGSPGSGGPSRKAAALVDPQPHMRQKQEWDAKYRRVQESDQGQVCSYLGFGALNVWGFGYECLLSFACSRFVSLSTAT